VATVEIRSSSAPIARLRVRARSPDGQVTTIRTRVVERGVRRGSFRFPTAGAWTLFATDPPRGRVHSVAQVRVRVLDPVPTAPPEGFGALGRRQCDPPSPASGEATGLRDVFGTALGGEEFWALPFLPVGATWPTPHFAVFEGLVGKEIKIVFGMTSFHRPFRAIAPTGAPLKPKWGPSFHTGSTWDRRPGVEWGAGFVFPEPGCWRIQAGSLGDLWLLIRS
jgi:hypothetical protein